MTRRNFICTLTWHQNNSGGNSSTSRPNQVALGQFPLLFAFWCARFPVHSNVKIKHHNLAPCGQCCQLPKAGIRPHFEAAAANGAKKQVFASLLIYCRRDRAPASSEIKETRLPPVFSCCRAWSHPVTSYRSQGSPLNFPTCCTDLCSSAFVGHSDANALGRLHCRHDTFPTRSCSEGSPIEFLELAKPRAACPTRDAQTNFAIYSCGFWAHVTWMDLWAEGGEKDQGCASLLFQLEKIRCRASAGYGYSSRQRTHCDNCFCHNCFRKILGDLRKIRLLG